MKSPQGSLTHVPLPDDAFMSGALYWRNAAAACSTVLLPHSNAWCAAGQGSGWQRPLPNQDPGHLPGLEEALQRRTMYPAGRILHLVPARLVFTAEELAKLGKPCISGLSCTHARMQEKHRLCHGQGIGVWLGIGLWLGIGVWQGGARGWHTARAPCD